MLEVPGDPYQLHIPEAVKIGFLWSCEFHVSYLQSSESRCSVSPTQRGKRASSPQWATLGNNSRVLVKMLGKTRNERGKAVLGQICLLILKEKPP